MSFVVDTHHHMLPDFFWRETNDPRSPVGGIAPPPWSKEGSIALMDEAGIDFAITSVSTPGVHIGDDAKARSLARRCNELAATLMQQRPDRSGGKCLAVQPGRPLRGIAFHGDVERRFLSERGRDRYPLSLATGQLPAGLIGPIAETDPGQ